MYLGKKIGDDMKKIKFLLMLFLLSLLILSNVDAIGDPYPGNPGLINGCGSGNCYSAAVGFRLTIVNNSTGRRCKYDPKTNSICTATSGPDKTGYESKSADFWFDPDALEGRDSDYCYAFTDKKIKSEFVTTLENSGIGNVLKKVGKCRDGFSEIYSMTALGIPPVNSSKYIQHWYDNGDHERAERSVASNMVRVIEPWLRCQEDPNNPKICPKSTDLNGNAYKKDPTVFNNIFNYLLCEKNGNACKISDVYSLNGLENSRIEIEQIVMFTNRSHGKFTMGIYGTVAETSLIYEYMNKVSGLKSANDAKWCYAGKEYTTSYGQTSCSVSAIKAGYVDGWRGENPIGNQSVVLSI
jgi:hypothetical protein